MTQDQTEMTYPIRVLSFGAGVQSSTLLRMAIAGEIEPVQHAIFSDTGWEPKAVYEHMKDMRVLAEAAGIEFHIVSNGNIRDDLFNPDARFASMPLHIINPQGSDAMSRRQCTAEYKIKPLLAEEREIAGLKAGQRCKEHRITTLIGISLDEVQRMKNPAFPWIVNEYPLVDLRMTRHDCLLYHERAQLERPPRSACIGCPYHSDREWRNIRDTDPESWQDAIFIDDQIRNNPVVADRLFQGRAYLHSKRIPLSVVDLSTEEDRGQINMFGNECEGMCGL
jgi:hypothetical protein